jgi:hypothetical protein
LFDDRPAAPPAASLVREAAEAPVPLAAADHEEATDSETTDAEPAAVDTAAEEASPQVTRKRLAEQLDALKRKEAELRRALAVADHPEIAEAIRTIEGRVYAVKRAETKISQGFSKSEARRRDVIEKKLGTLREKRAELDQQISTLETELGTLGSDRLATFESERAQALEQLFIALATHDPALHAAGFESSNLLPELSEWMPEIEALAKTVSERSPVAQPSA